jgi:hypothetical protein
LGSQIRRISFGVANPSWKEFNIALQETLGTKTINDEEEGSQNCLCIYYLDEEGDKVLVDSELEWKEALIVLNSQIIKKIFVEENLSINNNKKNKNRKVDRPPRRKNSSSSSSRRQLSSASEREDIRSVEQNSNGGESKPKEEVISNRGESKTKEEEVVTSISSIISFPFSNEDINDLEQIFPRIQSLLLSCPELYAIIPTLLGSFKIQGGEDDDAEMNIDLNEICSKVNSVGVKLLDDKKTVQGRELFRLAHILQPEQHLFLYNLACAESILGNIDGAFENLEEAVDCGFLDAKHLEKDPDFENISKLPQFVKIVDSLKKKNNNNNKITTEKENESSLQVELEAAPFVSSQPIVQEKSKHEEALEILKGMGFVDREMNEALLEAYGDLTLVLNHLLRV